MYELTGQEGPLFQPIYNLISTNQWVEMIVTTLIIFLQGFFINKLVMNHNFMRPPNFVTAFCFIILASLSVDFFGFSNVLMANFFMLFAFNELFLTFKLYRSAIHIFNAGFLMAIAALIYFPLFFIYFACSVTLLILRPYKIRERLQLLTGFVMPFYLICMWYYLKGNLTEFYTQFLQIQFTSLPFSLEATAENLVYLFYLIIMLLVILSYRKLVSKKGLEIEKKIDALYWLCFFCFLTAYLSGPLSMPLLLVLAFPLSVLLAMFLVNIRQKLISETLALGFLVYLFFIHFYLT